MAAFFQVRAELLVIVDLAVKDDPFRFVLIADRLLAARKIDDRQAPHRHADILVGVKTFLVRAAMDDGAIHCLEDLSVYSAAIVIYKTCDSTHLSVERSLREHTRPRFCPMRVLRGAKQSAVFPILLPKHVPHRSKHKQENLNL